jgi:hypothetical protein
MGESTLAVRTESQQPVGLDTYAGKIHMEWDPQAAVTPLGRSVHNSVSFIIIPIFPAT